VAELAAVTTANSAPACTSLGDFYWEVGTGTAKLFGFSRGSTVTAATELPLASASKWLYASAYVQSKGYANLTAAEKKRLNFTSGFLERGDIACGDVGTTVSECYGPAYKDVGYRILQDGNFFYDGGHMQKLALEDIGSRQGTGLLSVVDWLNNQLGTSLPENANAVAVAGGFRGSAADYRVFLQKLLTNQYGMSFRLTADTVPAYAGGPGVSYTPWSGGQQAYYGLGHWVERESVGGVWQVTGHSSPGAFGFYPWVDAGKEQYMLLARARNTSGEGELSRVCAHKLHKAYTTGTPQP
jgi:CubicO group peptidase (beta-lactamase class C family)